MTEASLFQAMVPLGFQEILRFLLRPCAQAQSGSQPTDSFPNTDGFDRNAQCSQAALSNSQLLLVIVECSSLRTVSSCLTYSLPKGGLLGNGAFEYFGL